MAEPQVLVVDDDPGILDLVVRRLERRGLHPDSAPDGPTAVEMLKEKSYDLVVTDIYMPGGLTGLDILRKVKEIDAHVQVIVVTAAAALDNAVDALNQGAFSYLIKPFDHLSVIDNSVTRALDYRRLILDNQRMAEIQRRRGDLLEAEVTDRIQLMRRKQQDTAEMLARLPVGLIVADAEGKLLLTNAVAEEWMKRRAKNGKQPLQEYLDRLIPPTYSTTTELPLDEVNLRITAQPLPPLQGKLRTLIVVQEHETAPAAGAGGTGGAVSMAARLKPAIDWLAERPLPAEEGNVVRGLQMQLLALERLQDAEGGPPALPPPRFDPDARRAPPVRTRALEGDELGAVRSQPPVATPIVLTQQGLEARDSVPAAAEGRRAPDEAPAPKATPPRGGMLKKGLARKAGDKPGGASGKP